MKTTVFFYNKMKLFIQTNKWKILLEFRARWLFPLFLLFFSQVSFAKEKPTVVVRQSSQQIWQRQQLLLTLQVNTDDTFSRLEADDFTMKGWHVIPFPMKSVEGQDETQLTLKWAIYPFASGKQSIQLPEIRYRPNRGRKQILPTKKITIQVQKLPIYIPPTMPVGNIKLESSWNDGVYKHNNELAEWRVKVLAENVVEQTMPPIKQQIKSTESLYILPIQSFASTSMTEEGVINQRDYIIPVKALSNGKIDIPKIEVQYFDPIKAKLEKVTLNPPFIISLNKIVFWVGSLFILFSLLLLLLRLLFLAEKFLSIYCQKKQAIELLNKASNYQQVRSAVNQLSIVEGWEPNQSLSEFLQNWEKKFGKSIRLQEKVVSLQMKYFSRVGGAFAKK